MADFSDVKKTMALARMPYNNKAVRAMVELDRLINSTQGGHMAQKNPLVICAFPGSYHGSLDATYVSPLEDVDFIVMDDKSDLVQEVKKSLAKGHHAVVHAWGSHLTELEDADVPYILVYPDVSRKWELTVKATQLMSASDIGQGHKHWFVAQVGPMWEQFIAKCERNRFCVARYCMGPELFLDELLSVNALTGNYPTDETLNVTKASVMMLEKAPADQGKGNF
jgi:hypothetical protein